jgi:hypothetical protein
LITCGLDEEEELRPLEVVGPVPEEVADDRDLVEEPELLLVGRAARALEAAEDHHLAVLTLMNAVASRWPMIGWLVPVDRHVRALVVSTSGRC